MALGKCRECGRECAKSAKVCPGCGVSQPVKGWTLGAKVGFAFLILLLIGMWKNSGTKTRSSGGVPGVMAAAADPAPEQPSPVTISTLLSEYKDNEVRADQTYKGHTISTSGKVGNIKKDITNSIYVIVGTGAMFEIPSVQCFPSDAQASKAAALSKGDIVTIQGRVDGLMMNVLVKDCEILSSKRGGVQQ